MLGLANRPEERRNLALLAARGARVVVGSVTDPAALAEALAGATHVDHLAVVLEGTFRVEVPDRHGLPVEVATFRAGDYSGEMSFLRGERASATVRATVDGALLMIPHSLLAEVAAGEV